MPRRKPISFLADHNVAMAVSRFLNGRGHDVAVLADLMPMDTPDPVVATAAIEAGRILLSWDRDFNHQRFMQERFAALSRIGFSCPEPEGAARLAEVIDVVEFAVARAKGHPVRIRVARDKVQIQC